MKEDWWKYALLALAAVAWWFVQAELKENREQSVLKWQEAARTKQCFMEELSKMKERMSHIEGFHEAERMYKKK
jgi:hypothetical protein